MTKDFKELVDGFRSKKILVLGDAMLDLYIRGTVDRISPEAPVPVVVERRREYVLGGAGNVAANIASLGGRVALCGVLGNDEEGRILRKLCRKMEILPIFVLERGRPTTLKTRGMAARHQLLRIDREIAAPIKGATERRIIAALGRLRGYDFVVISDYTKGCITKKLMEFLKKNFGARKIVVGAKPANAQFYRGTRLVVLNRKEGEALAGVFIESDRDASRAAKELARRFNSSIVLTRGEKGMTVYDRAVKKIFQLPARALEVYDVTGAGDTALAAIALALAAGASVEEAADVANHAAGVVVGKEGTVAVKPAELLEAIKAHNHSYGR